MEELRNFRKANNLTQDQLGEFLGIKKSFISRVENDQVALPEEKFKKLMSNNMGWDTSMLQRVNETPIPPLPDLEGKKHLINFFEGPRTNRATYRDLTAKHIEYLERRINELEKQNAEYWEMIKRLTEK